MVLNRVAFFSALWIVLATSLTAASDANPEDFWQSAELFKTPRCRRCPWPESEYQGMQALLVEGRGPGGTDAEFFAYFAKPGRPAPKGGFPGLLLVHGGGGTAFPNYIREFVKDGFAVLALDWYNQRPAPALTNVPPGEVSLPRVPLAGGKRQDHVANVANMVLAHSLLRSFPEVDASRTVYVGLSWGSWYGSCVTAVDGRFKGACMIYLCDRHPDATADPKSGKFVRGPFHRSMKVPSWWIVWPQDSNGLPSTMQDGWEACPCEAGRTIVHNLGHSHEGFSVAAVHRMARFFAGEDVRVPRLSLGRRNGRTVSAEIIDAGKGVAEALLWYTERPPLGIFELTKNAKTEWCSAPARIEGTTVSATLPEGARIAFLSVYEAEQSDSRRRVFSGSSGFFHIEDIETAKWQNEIDRVAAAGGGVVTVPAGVHKVGGLELRNNVELHLEKGAVLEALYGLENYRVVKLPYSEGDWSAIVMGLNVTNVAVTGEGTIDGQGAKWPAPPKDFKGCQEGLRPRGLFFAHSKGIRLEGYTLRNAACWGQVFKNCEDVTARRVNVFSHGNLNNDGFDIEAKNVLIEECVVDTGDDEFCIKSNDPSFTVENVTIRNCVARGQASAFKIGTATRGIVRHVRVENLRCEPPRGIFSQYADGTPAKPLFHLTVYHHPESYPYGFGLVGVAVECVDGGRVEDVVVDGVTFADGYKIPIFVRADRRDCHNKGDGLKRGDHNVLKDIVIRNLKGYVIGPTASSITGTKDFRVQNVLLENIDIVQLGAGEAAGRLALADPAPYRENCYPAPDIFYPGILSAYGLYVDYADNVVLKNVKFRTLAEGPVEIRPDVVRTGR